MRLHTDSHTGSSINAALQAAKDAGRVDHRVAISELAERGSRTRGRAYEIRLEWRGFKMPGDGRRPTNPGTGPRHDEPHYAAFYDEWGWFILELFRLDPGMTFGSYKSEDDFHSQTRFAFVPEYV